MSTALMSAPSGLPDVDRRWGGFDAGHTYLLVGRAGAGRSQLALRVVQATVEAGARCLLLSPRPPAELVEIGQAVSFDLARAHRDGLLRPLRIPTAAELAVKGTAGLEAAYRDLVQLVRAEAPARVVVEDFTPLVQFDSFEGLNAAFSGLVAALRDLDAALVVGLGAPANEASRHLLDIVRRASDGTIEVQDDGALALDGPSGDDAAAPPAVEPDAFADEAEDASPAGPEAVAVDADPFEAETDAEADLDDADTEAPAAEAEHAPEGGVELLDEGGAATDAFAEEPVAAEPADAPEGDHADHPAPPPEARPSDEAPSPEADLEQAAPDEPASDELADEAASQETLASIAGTPSGDGASPEAVVVPPPPVDPSLVDDVDDAFASDPADALMEQGYIVDSSSRQGGDGARYSGAAEAPAFSAPPGGPDVEFRRALASAFQTRSAGVPFLVVAARMQPGAPEAAHFPSVTAALRSALPPSAQMLSNDARKRSIVLLPMSGPEAGQALFAELQAGLRRTIGLDAEATLQAISAVTVPDGQPFTSPSDLMAYAYDG